MPVLAWHASGERQPLESVPRTTAIDEMNELISFWLSRMVTATYHRVVELDDAALIVGVLRQLLQFGLHSGDVECRRT